MGIGPSEPNIPLFTRVTFCEHLRIACTKTFTAELMDVSGLWNLNEKKVEGLFYLLIFGLLEVKDDLDRTGRKKKLKNAKKLHALECGPGCTSWICNNWTAGLMAENKSYGKILSSDVRN